MAIARSFLFTTDGGNVHVADADTLEARLVGTFFDPNDPETPLAFTDIAIDPNTGIVWGATERQLYELDLDRDVAIGRFNTFAGDVTSLAVDGQGRFAVGFSNQGFIQLTESPNSFGTAIGSLAVEDRLQGDIEVVGTRLFAATTEERLISYDIGSNTLLSNVAHNRDDVQGLVWLPGEEALLAITELDGTFLIDPEEGVVGAPGFLDFEGGGVPTGAASVPLGLIALGPGGGTYRSPLPGLEIRGEGGRDKLFSELGGATLDGGRGNDRLVGDEGRDVLIGGAGKDRMDGRGGNDQMRGGGQRDRMDGGDGKDRMSGQGGADRMRGEDGADRLSGGGGRDRIDGGAGRDRLEGDRGRDRFEFSQGDGKDRILDWRDGEKIAFDSGPGGFGALRLRQKGDDVLIRYGGGDQIRVEDADLSEFGRADFVFA